MSNFQDRVDEIEGYREEIADCRKRLRSKGLTQEEREELKETIGQYEIAIEAVQEEGGIPDFY